MKNFKVDYDNKTLQLNIYGKEFTWDLNDGDIGDFWHSFTYGNKTYDINFYQENESQDPVLEIYDIDVNGINIPSLVERLTNPIILGNNLNYFSPNRNEMTAQKLYDILSAMESDGINLSKVTINYRTNSDSDVEVVNYVGEDLYDESSNSVLESIVFMSDASDYE